MDYILIGDIHGRPLSGLSHFLDQYNPDGIFCLGDFDYTKTMRDFMEIEKSFISKGKNVVSVPGNHDHCVYHNIDMSSPTLMRQRMTIDYLHKRLTRDDEVKLWLESLLKIRGGVTLNLNNTTRASIIHGAYDGHNYDDNIEDRDMWTRVVTEEDHKKNFAAMKQRGIDIMIRGHDHKPVYAYQEDDIVVANTKHGDTFELIPGRLHTINPGAFIDGWLATISVETDKNPILKYIQFPKTLSNVQ